MVHKCRWLPVDGTGIGSDFARSIRATSIPTPCEMEGGQMRHNPGRAVRNKDLQKKALQVALFKNLPAGLQGNQHVVK